VRRDVGRHADRDARLPVDEQIRNTGRQDRGLVLRLVVVRTEIDRFLLDVREQLVRHPGHAHFGVTHGRRHVAIDRPEIALAVDEQVAHRERLRHPHHGFVDGRIAVRVVFTDDVADDAGGFLVGLVPVIAELAHGEQDTTMDGLQTITNVGQRAPDDHAHGIVEVGLPHLVFEADGQYFTCDIGHSDSGIVRPGRPSFEKFSRRSPRDRKEES